MDYEIWTICGGKNDGKVYLRSDNGKVSQLFKTEKEAENAAFQQNIKWEDVD